MLKKSYIPPSRLSEIGMERYLTGEDMKRAVLKAKDGKTYYGDPYVANHDGGSKYLLGKKSFYMQDLDELMKAISKNGLDLLDVIDYEVEGV